MPGRRGHVPRVCTPLPRPRVEPSTRRTQRTTRILARKPRGPRPGGLVGWQGLVEAQMTGHGSRERSGGGADFPKSSKNLPVWTEICLVKICLYFKKILVRAKMLRVSLGRLVGWLVDVTIHAKAVFHNPVVHSPGTLSAGWTREHGRSVRSDSLDSALDAPPETYNK